MLTILKESILDQDVDAIVNPANSWLRHGGGLARLIADKARGPELENPGEDVREWAAMDHDSPLAIAWDKEQSDHPLIATGDAGWTSAGYLPFKGIIHAVGPVWGGGHVYEDDLLFLAYCHALQMGLNKGYKSIAFPAISAGIFGVPLEVVAHEACQALTGRDESLDLRICLMTDEEVDVFRAELSTYPGYQRTT